MKTTRKQKMLISMLAILCSMFFGVLSFAEEEVTVPEAAVPEVVASEVVSEAPPIEEPVIQSEESIDQPVIQNEEVDVQPEAADTNEIEQEDVKLTETPKEVETPEATEAVEEAETPAQAESPVSTLSEGEEVEEQDTELLTGEANIGDSKYYEDMTERIKIIKYDGITPSIRLEGAVFELTRLSDNEKFILTTDAKGEALSERLAVGEYSIREIKAPFGFQEMTITLNTELTSEGRIIEIPNRPYTTDIHVEKVWIGKALDSLKISLYAGEEKVSTVTVTEEDDWKYTFESRPKYNRYGEEIVYTVEEERLLHYHRYVEEFTDDTSEFKLFKITNVELSKMIINVYKKWEGKELESVTVHLLKDGEIYETKQMTADNWATYFYPLPKYNLDGTEPVYTVVEDKIDGYTTIIKEVFTDDEAPELTVTITNREITPPDEEDPPVEDPPKEDPPVEDPPKEDPPAEDPPVKEDPPGEEKPPVKEDPEEDKDKPIGGVESDQPGKPDPDKKQDTPKKYDPVKPGISKTIVPKTGDNLNMVVNALLLLVAAAALVFVRKTNTIKA